MSSVISVIPRVSLPNAGLMEPELGDGQVCHMTFVIINGLAADPFDASTNRFLIH